MRIFAATSRYIQGPGVIDDLGRYALELGSNAIVVVDADVNRLFGTRIERSFTSQDAIIQMFLCPGEVTKAAIDALSENARPLSPNIVVGVGGGKSIDTAKGVARLLGTRFVSVPTIASNDGPASASIALYDDHHALVEVQQLKRNADLVLVDTRVIVDAPLRFLLAGVGDAISKTFEAQACAAAGAATLFGGKPSHTGLVVADACYDIIRKHGAAALRAASRKEITEDVELLIEATVLLSTLAFENGGLSIAHAIARGFPMIQRAAGTLHGSHVAYGLLVQLMLEGREASYIDDIITLFAELGLPRRLADFGLTNPTTAEVQQLAEGAMSSPSVKRFVRQMTPGQIAEAIWSVEAIIGG
ncbi:glycerol dehydrogenase [Paraburkholderia phymatum]|uniref:glycerol dehydrogenase n=1 Tax=Paraburkholderia phymatum TaxID=148447 RepID=UPI0031818037